MKTKRTYIKVEATPALKKALGDLADRLNVTPRKAVELAIVSATERAIAADGEVTLVSINEKLDTILERLFA